MPDKPFDLVLDVETKLLFAEVGSRKPEELGVSYVGTWKMGEGEDALAPEGYEGFLEEDLGRFWPLAERARRLVGFNLVGFDLPALSSYYVGNFTRFKVFDLMDEIAKAFGRRVSLNAVAKGSLGEQKSGDGLGAIAYVKAKDWASLAKYCKRDVELTARLYLYAKKHSKLRFQDHWNEYREVPVDASFAGHPSESKVQMTFGL